MASATTFPAASTSSPVTRRPASGSLAELVDIILDKGLVLDVYARVSLVGIELLTVDVRVVIASVDTYLHFAEATNRLDLRGQAEERDTDLTDFVSEMQESGARSQTRGALEGAGDKIKSVFGSDDDEEEEEEVLDEDEDEDR